MSCTCFVTVGTTQFDELITIIDDSKLQHLLQDKYGVHRLVIQHGRGILRAASRIEGLRVDSYDFKSSLQEDMMQADLIVSHAGAGSVMEALRMGKPLLVVVNDGLMDNHQIELARALEKGKYLACAKNPGELNEVLADAPLHLLKKYPDKNPKAFADMMDEEMGFA